MRKNYLRPLAIALATTTVLATGCSKSSSVTETETTEVITTEESTTEEETTEEETTEETTTEEETTEEETEEATTEEETEEETSKDGKKESKEDKKETSSKETTEKETTTKETTVAPTTTPAPTTVAETTTQAPVITLIEGSIVGTHYTGDNLTASDFKVVVTYSDGTKVTNPAGFGVAPLTVQSGTYTYNVVYNGATGTFAYTGTEKPTQSTTTQTNTGNTSTTSSSKYASYTYDGFNICAKAEDYLCTPYSQMDCLSFVVKVYNECGIPLTSDWQNWSSYGKKVELWDAKAGDIVVYENNGVVTHCGIWAENGSVFDSLETVPSYITEVSDTHQTNGVVLHQYSTSTQFGYTKIYAVELGTNTRPSDVSWIYSYEANNNYLLPDESELVGLSDEERVAFVSKYADLWFEIDFEYYWRYPSLEIWNFAPFYRDREITYPQASIFRLDI